MAKLSIYKYGRLDAGWRYCKAAFHPNGKIKPNIVILKGQEQKHAEGSYFLNFSNQWLPVGPDALEAQRKRAVRLAQMDYERLSGNVVAPTQASNMIQFAGERKIIQAEVDAYLVNLELAKRSLPGGFFPSFLTITARKKPKRGPWAARPFPTRRGGGEKRERKKEGGLFPYL